VSNLFRGVIVERLTQRASTQYPPIVSPVIATVAPEGWAAVTFGVFYDMGFGHYGPACIVPRRRMKLRLKSRSSIYYCWLQLRRLVGFVDVIVDVDMTYQIPTQAGVWLGHPPT
jgi:hypothetical protein